MMIKFKRWTKNLPWLKRPSVCFVSLHKAGTTLITDHVLPHARDLKHVDYAREIWMNPRREEISQFNRRGYLYGVIRVPETIGSKSRRERLLDWPFFEAAVFEWMPMVMMLRDPRDLLVSHFYSVAYSHALNPDQKNRTQALKKREQAKEIGLDAWVVARVGKIHSKFEFMDEMRHRASDCCLLTYEDMILDFESFWDRLNQVVRIDSGIKNEIYKKSRPRDSEQINQHKRSGKIGGFREKLKPETVQMLNQELGEVMLKFGYKPE
jgi:hypothetical protein